MYLLVNSILPRCNQYGQEAYCDLTLRTCWLENFHSTVDMHTLIHHDPFELSSIFNSYIYYRLQSQFSIIAEWEAKQVIVQRRRAAYIYIQSVTLQECNNDIVHTCIHVRMCTYMCRTPRLYLLCINIPWSQSHGQSNEGREIGKNTPVPLQWLLLPGGLCD